MSRHVWPPLQGRLRILPPARTLWSLCVCVCEQRSVRRSCKLRGPRDLGQR